MISEFSAAIFKYIITGILLITITAGCGQNQDQRDFESEAFRTADGFTETSDTGEILSEDPDDWRIAPFFQGLVEVRPAYPNPVQTTDQLKIDVEVTGIEAVSGLQLFVYYFDDSIKPVYSDQRSPLPPGLSVISVNPIELGRFNTVESARGLHRVVLTDGNENIITYGDIKVE